MAATKKKTTAAETAAETTAAAAAAKTAAAAETAVKAKKTNTKAAAAASTVTVALNYPTGINFEIGTRRIRIAGNGERLKGKEQGVIVPGGYGLTTISASDWEAIKAKYGKMRIFSKGLIFASSSKADAEDEAEEKSELRNGYEPVDTKKTATKEASEA